MIREAASEQDEIGWIEFYKGHLSKEWATIQLKHYCNMYKNPPSITHWSKTIISRIYNITFEMWSNRNKEVHNEYEDNMNKIESEKLQQEITESYNKGASNVMVHHRYLLEETLDEKYTKKLSKIRNIGYKLYKQAAYVMKNMLHSITIQQEQST